MLTIRGNANVYNALVYRKEAGFILEFLRTVD